MNIIRFTYSQVSSIAVNSRQKVFRFHESSLSSFSCPVLLYVRRQDQGFPAILLDNYFFMFCHVGALQNLTVGIMIA